MKKIKNQKGITLVALVVTIIILIILAGVSINAVMGENGIITLAKRAKENIELAQIEEEKNLNELYTQLENQEELTQGTVSYNAVLRLNEFKKKIADYIDEAANGQIDTTNEYEKPNYETASTETFGNAIKQIVAKVTALDNDVAATASDIAEGKSAWVNGELINGLLKSNTNFTITINYTLKLAYWSSGGTVGQTKSGKGYIYYRNGELTYNLTTSLYGSGGYYDAQYAVSSVSISFD